MAINVLSVGRKTWGASAYTSRLFSSHHTTLLNKAPTVRQAAKKRTFYWFVPTKGISEAMLIWKGNHNCCIQTEARTKIANCSNPFFLSCRYWLLDQKLENTSSLFCIQTIGPKQYTFHHLSICLILESLLVFA